MGNTMKKKSRNTIMFSEHDRTQMFKTMMLFFKKPTAEFFQRVMIMLSQCDASHPDYQKIVTWALAVLQKYPEFRSVNSNKFPMTMESLLRIFDSGASPLVLKKTMVDIQIPQRIQYSYEIDLLWMAYGATGSPKYVELIQRVVDDVSHDVSIRKNADWSLRKHKRIYPNLVRNEVTPSIIIPLKKNPRISITSPASI